MFAVLFEVHPKADQWEAYLGYAKLLADPGRASRRSGKGRQQVFLDHHLRGRAAQARHQAADRPAPQGAASGRHQAGAGTAVVLLDAKRSPADGADAVELASRVVRDYGMYDRREAPQYYADARDRDPAL
jgi:hypothetical protein